MSAQHKAAQKREDIESHFTKFQRNYRQYHIKPCNLHNFDETGFQVGYLAGQIMFNRTEKQVYISDPDNHKLVILMKLISTEDETTNLILIMPGQVMKKKHFSKSLNDDIRIRVSKSGYTNNLLSYI